MMQRYSIALIVLFASAMKPAAAASCSAYASSLVFGLYKGSAVSVTGSVTVTCTSGTTYHIGLNAGNTPGATVTDRFMFGGQGGQNKLGYQLFSDAALTINWGDTSGTNWVTGVGNGSAQPYTIYALIPANEVVPQGSYTDTITASISGSFTTATAQFSVTSTVEPGCAVAATNLDFGGYSGTVINSASAILVICSPGIFYSIGLNEGTATGATVTQRSMTGPGGVLLHYGLFRDFRHTLNWGNTPGVDVESSTGTGHFQPWFVFGELPAQQSAPSGAYSDLITVTVTY